MRNEKTPFWPFMCLMYGAVAGAGYKHVRLIPLVVEIINTIQQ